MYACLMLFFISNAIEGQMISTGAFEILYNGKSLKLKCIIPFEGLQKHDPFSVKGILSKVPCGEDFWCIGPLKVQRSFAVHWLRIRYPYNDLLENVPINEMNFKHQASLFISSPMSEVPIPLIIFYFFFFIHGLKIP